MVCSGSVVVFSESSRETDTPKALAQLRSRDSPSTERACGSFVMTKDAVRRLLNHGPVGPCREGLAESLWPCERALRAREQTSSGFPQLHSPFHPPGIGYGTV